MSNLLEQASLVLIPSGYKEDVVYSEIPLDGAGDLSFSRASNGTRVNSAGLVEVCPWNLASDSNDFGGLSAITKTSGQPSPIDSTSGSLLTATGSGEHYSGTASLTVVVGNTYTYSVYAKFVQGLNIALRTVFSNGDADISTIWNLNTGTLVSNATDHTSPTITAVGNGWYRVSITYRPLTVPAFPLLFRLQMAVGTSLSFTATSGDGFLVYGAQINNGALAPYFPTTDRLNVPRLTYQNGGGGCPSLLLEKQSTNLTVQSNAFNTSPWVSNEFNGTIPVITANYGISPDGTQNASRIILERTNSSASYSQIYQYPISVTNGASYTWSVWLKSLSGTPTISIIGDFGRPSVTLTNEWVRYSGTGTASSSSSQLEIAILGSNFASGNSLTADFLAWGYQFEASSYPTSYINTTSASATRVADACFKDSITSLIGQTEGTIFADIVRTTSTSNDTFWVNISDGTTNDWIFMGTEGTAGRFYVRVGNSVKVDEYPAFSVGRHKIALAYKSGQIAGYMDGVQLFTSTATFTITSLTRISFGPSSASGNTINTPAQINQAVIFPTRLTNAELASLTTI